MNSIKCSHCGLTNWSTDDLCKRCGASLMDDGNAARPAAAEESSGSPLKKLLLILFLIAIVAVPVWIWLRHRGRNHELAAAIQSSTLFTKPVTVEASKTNAVIGSLSPEAVTLRDAGLLVVETETPVVQSAPPVSVTLPASADQSPSDPPRTVLIQPPPFINFRIPTSRLTPKDMAAAQDWQAIEDSGNHKTGWIVPVGTRELIGVTSVEEVDSENAKVNFTWNWKPDQVGKNFDFELFKESDPHGRPRINPRLSSTFSYSGAAELGKTGNGWEVKSIKWNLEMPERAY